MTLNFINYTRTACTYYTCAQCAVRVGFEISSVIASQCHAYVFLSCFIQMQRYKIFKRNPNFWSTICAPKSKENVSSFRSIGTEPLQHWKSTCFERQYSLFCLVKVALSRCNSGTIHGDSEYATYNSVYATEKFVRATHRFVHAVYRIVRGVFVFSFMVLSVLGYQFF